MQQSSAQLESSHRQRIVITGVVQGVGFRPFVYGLAQRFALSGFVGNDSHGVFIEVEGAQARLTAFQQALQTEQPPLAYIDTITVAEIDPKEETTFTIVESHTQATESTLISPDLTVCDDCLAELLNPSDRRYRYPFINCTNCGPRFTITSDIPYDRPLTTMADFPMCPVCQAEYTDPLNRRFHAQPNACPTCGPQLEFRWSTQDGEPFAHEPVHGDGALRLAKTVLRQGGLVALKGIGGFHLACDATNESAVQELRTRKGRAAKPFAVMAANVETVRRFASINDAEFASLTSRERPIVLLQKQPDFALAAGVAPGNHTIGVMLPYSPLHHLLFVPDDAEEEPPPVLVMTSGNYAGEPIERENATAIVRLSPLVDAFLLHDRAIHVPCDDAVVRVVDGQEVPIRRSRGYAPFPVKLPVDLAPTLAVGGELKSTFCLTQGRFAFMSQHIGDMENLETLDAFSRAVDHFTTIFRVTPQRIAADLHPRYLSTHWAEKMIADERWPSTKLIQVQHHHAHIAGLMAEHALDGSTPILGICFDGTGYGPDGTIWGGEVLLADYRGYQRLAHLKPLPLPGGDAAVKRPYRLALAWLWACGLPWDTTLPPVAVCPPTERAILQRQLERNLNCVATSSMGRLFDVVSSLTGICQNATYEAQAAIELESCAQPTPPDPRYHFVIAPSQNTTAEESPLIIDPTPILRAVIDDMHQCAAPSVIAMRFHIAVAALVVDLCTQLHTHMGLLPEQAKQPTASSSGDRIPTASSSGDNIPVALSGGVFQNGVLLQQTCDRLRQHGFVPLTHRHVPANDGGLALGQAVIANFMEH